jgi:hypothetical protein
MSAPHAVAAKDEQRHPSASDALWSESYYADFVHEDGTWGGWFRLGFYPNLGVAWWTTWLVGVDRPGICSVDYQVPVFPGSELDWSRGQDRIALRLTEPLARFAIAASMPARVVAEPHSVYGEGGTSDASPEGRLDVDLEWTTDGAPYHYDLTTRYEIPCTVEGTVTVDGVTSTVKGQGQRDHSWGIRDWWAFGWCWSSACLDDGTRIHLTDVRIPGMPVAFGYVQQSGRTALGPSVHPVTELSVREELGPHGFPERADITVTAGPALHLASVDGGAAAGPSLSLVATPIAFGPVHLRSTDGRLSRFPRALVRYTLDDGRSGLGWIEWNQPES